MVSLFIISLSISMLFPESSTRGLLRNADISPTDVYENQWALIIGINQYPNFIPLKYAVADANSMKVTLMTQYGFIGGVQMTLIHGDDFTIDMTERALLADYITQGNETRLLVITPETDELFSFEGDFEIAELIVANSHAEVSVDDLPLAVSFSLSDAYPNPFNPATTMKLVMPVAGDMQVEVYNLLGQVVATLTSGYRDAGTYNLTWDATDVTSGMYFIKAQADGFTKTQKLMLIK